MDHFHLIIVTGMSGAGKTHAVQVLEDIGYFCIDNIPPVLIPKFAELCIKAAKECATSPSLPIFAAVNF